MDNVIQQHVCDRYLTEEEAAKYRKIRELVAGELPELRRRAKARRLWLGSHLIVSPAGLKGSFAPESRGLTATARDVSASGLLWWSKSCRAELSMQ